MRSNRCQSLKAIRPSPPSKPVRQSAQHALLGQMTFLMELFSSRPVISAANLPMIRSPGRRYRDPCRIGESRIDRLLIHRGLCGGLQMLGPSYSINAGVAHGATVERRRSIMLTLQKQSPRKRVPGRCKAQRWISVPAGRRRAAGAVGGDRGGGAAPDRRGRNARRNTGSPDSPFRRRNGSRARPDGRAAICRCGR